MTQHGFPVQARSAFRGPPRRWTESTRQHRATKQNVGWRCPDQAIIRFPTVLKLTDKVFHRLLNTGYTINLQKCQFLPLTLLYLGHIIEDGIIRPNPKKIEAIQLLKSPSTSHEVRPLLGVTGFLQAFIPNYSQATAPITDLLKGVPSKKTRAVKINWTTKCDDALTELKRLVIGSALVQPLNGDEFLLEVDACSYAIGGVLKLKRDGAWLPVH